MKATTFKTVAVGVLCVCLVVLCGCPPAAPARTSNQGGGSIVTAGVKIAGGTMTGLTADEIQIVTDTVSDMSTEFAIDVTDEQAAAAVEFLVENNLNTVQDIQVLVEQGIQDPGSVVIPDSVQALIEAGNIPEITFSWENFDFNSLF